jgi:hypothetical protein
MKLITETIDEIRVITEAREDGKKNMYLEGIFMMAEAPNRNGRIYPRGVLENAVNKYTDKYIKENRAYSELGHPQGPSINLERVCGLHKSLIWEGNHVMGRMKVTNTPYGKIVEGLIDDGARLGMSSRGMGSVAEGKNGIMEVKNDFVLATAADVVADPSATQAFVRGIMENVDWVYDSANDSWKAQKFIEQAKQDMRKMTVSAINEGSIALFEKYLNTLISR